MHRLVPLAALLPAALFTVPSLGAGHSIEAVDVGLGGAYRAGEWAPLAIRMGSDGRLPTSFVVETVTTDADGSFVVRRSPAEVTGDGGKTASVRSVFQAGRLGSDLTVRVRDAEGALLAERRLGHGTAELPEPLPKGATLWVTAGSFERPAGRSLGFPVPAGVTGADVSTDSPPDGLGYAAADLVIVRGDFDAGAERSEALRQWVAGGGHLAIALGEKTSDFLDGPLAGWVPVRVGAATQVFDLTKVEDYVRSDRPMPRARRVAAARLVGAAQVLLKDPQGDFIVRSPYGFGRVTLFAFDLDVPPFSNWAALPDLLARALTESEIGEVSAGRADETGVSDLATQLLRAEEVLAGVARPTTGRTLLLLLAYAVVVGPLDYLIVHRLLRRPALTWVTFPTIVLLAAWWFNANAPAANGADAQVAQLDIVDVDPGSGTTRARSLVTLYSADSERVKLVAAAGSLANRGGRTPSPRLAWTAPPEDAFGGTFRAGSGGLFRSEYHLLGDTAAAEADGLPLLTGGSRRFDVSWQHGGGGELVRAELVGRGPGLLEGSVTHRLPGPVTNYLLAFGNRVYQPREADRPWPPGEPIEPDSGAFLRSDLRSFLTRARTSEFNRRPGEGGSTYIVTAGEYDPSATDVDSVVRMLTFHHAAGGTAYTGLTNLPLGDDDLTPLLELGRAVVLGRLDAPAVDVEVVRGSGSTVGAGKRSTFVRLVLPVEVVERIVPATLPPANP